MHKDWRFFCRPKSFRNRKKTVMADRKESKIKIMERKFKTNILRNKSNIFKFAFWNKLFCFCIFLSIHLLLFKNKLSFKNVLFYLAVASSVSAYVSLHFSLYVHYVGYLLIRWSDCKRKVTLGHFLANV